MRILFEDYVLDVARRELRRDSDLLALEPQVFDLLVYVIRNRDRVVSKDDLVENVWGGRIVSDSTLTTRINSMRKALGDSGVAQRLIRTVARKGIRFVGAVTEENAAPAASPDRPALALPSRPSIAVLPFANMSGDPEQEYFCDGMVEEIITGLSCGRSFFVIARNSSAAYKGKTADIKRIGEELGVRYVIEGSVRRSGQRIRVAAQLIDAASGVNLWARRYDRDLVDTFAIQDEITASIAASIEPELFAAERVKTKLKSPGSLDAWSNVVQATTLLHHFTTDHFDRAEPLLREAIAADPAYGRPRALLGFAISLGAFFAYHPDAQSRYALGKTLALEAIDLDPHDPWGHSALATAEVRLGHQSEALASVRKALELNPSFVLGHRTHGLVLTYLGRGREAREALDTAIRLNPLDPTNQTIGVTYAMSHAVEGDFARAREQAEATLKQRPDYSGAYSVLILALGELGERDAARKAANRLLEMRPTATADHFAIGMYDEPHRSRLIAALRAAGLP